MNWGVAVFAVLVVAKVAAFAAVGVPPAGEWVGAFGGDAAVALGVGLLGVVVRTRLVAWTVYGLLAGYAVVAAAVVQAIGTPPSFAMLEGIDPTMADSAAMYLTLRDLAGPIAVGLAALVAPRLSRLVAPRARFVGGVCGALLVAGMLLGGDPTLPAHRNALVFLLTSTRSLPSSDAQPAARPSHSEDGPSPLADLRAATRGHNVVVVVLESAAARFLRPYGAAEDPMPFLTELAAESLVFTHAYAVYPESIKGQIALFHSVHPAPRTDAADYARVPVPGLATRLREVGYATALFHSGRFRFLGMAEVLTRSGFELLADAATLGGQRESSFGVDEETTVAATLQWIDDHQDRPFFAAYLPVAGHHPYDSPPGGPFTYDTQLGSYRNALHYADRSVRALWDGLAQRGLAERTLFVVVGDHGQAFGEHDGNFGHTFAIYEENVHVPWLMRIAGAARPARRVDSVASHVDLVPTILDLCGMPLPDDVEGVSLLAPGRHAAMFFSDWGATLLGMRDGDLKFIHDADTGRDQLFDLRADPSELQDLAVRDPLRTRALRDLVRAFFLPRTTRVRGW